MSAGRLRQRGRGAGSFGSRGVQAASVLRQASSVKSVGFDLGAGLAVISVHLVAVRDSCEHPGERDRLRARRGHAQERTKPPAPGTLRASLRLLVRVNTRAGKCSAIQVTFCGADVATQLAHPQSCQRNGPVEPQRFFGTICTVPQVTVVQLESPPVCR